MKAVDLDCERTKIAKRAFTTRRVPAAEMRTLVTGDVRPKTGDLVLATVEEIGKHRKIEKPSGRRSLMMPGDEIIVCYGNRYAPDQFEALVPEDLSPCDLVAAGGIAANEIERHERMITPTRIAPLGLIGDAQGRPLNLSQYALDFRQSTRKIATVLVAGTAMNSGKTYSAASLIHGFKNKGFRVAGIKATGTGAGGDLWQMKDMGADVVMDFTDAGFASTYKVPPEEIERGVLGLIDHAARCRCTIAVVEIADGLQHQETATLLQCAALRRQSLGLLFAAYDSLGAVAGVTALRREGHKVLGLSGQLTRSPLAIRESQHAVDCRVYSAHELQAGAFIETLISHQYQPKTTYQAPKKPLPDIVPIPMVLEDNMAKRASNDVADQIAVGA
ncbi:MAG: hypothetical protein ACR2Q4_03430 [Geminicoccaceae bacterium]